MLPTWKRYNVLFVFYWCWYTCWIDPINNWSTGVDHSELLDTYRIYWDSIELLSLSRVRSGIISKSNINLNSLPTAMTHRGESVSSILYLFQVYCNFFMFCRMEMWLPLFWLTIACVFQKKLVFIRTHSFMFPLCQ